MRVERFYSSIKEEVSPLNENAIRLLDRQDYIGFFTACGSNYVRSIRRAQEVTAIFIFKSTSVETAQDFASNLRTSTEKSAESNQNSPSTTKSKFAAVSESLEIKILGFGLGLGQEGTGNLVAKTMQEYNEVMKFAFRAMTQTGGSSNDVGMVYGIEIVPWVDNVQFQVEAKLHEENVEIPIPRSLIPKAIASDGSDATFTNSTRADFTCKESSYSIDKYGYCCEIQSMYYVQNRTYTTTSPETSICRPLRSLDKSIVKNNMSSNAEFVARLDSAIRDRLNEFSALEKCVGAVKQIPQAFDYNILRPQATSSFDGSLTDFSVKELKIALDPFNDYSLVKHIGRELDEFMDMYYQPCISALFGTTSTNFMAYAWHTHPECNRLSCLAKGMRWNRGSGGGCVPSLLSGTSSTPYADNDSEGGCSFDSEADDDEERCKYPSSEMSQFYNEVKTCWGDGTGTLQDGRIDYFMTVFCMPSYTTDSLGEAEEQRVRDGIANCEDRGSGGGY